MTSGIEQRLNVIVQPHLLFPPTHLHTTHYPSYPIPLLPNTPPTHLTSTPTFHALPHIWAEPLVPGITLQSSTILKDRPGPIYGANRLTSLELDHSNQQINLTKTSLGLKGSLNENIWREIRFRYQYVCGALSICWGKQKYCKRNAANVQKTNQNKNLSSKCISLDNAQ